MARATARTSSGSTTKKTAKKTTSKTTTKTTKKSPRKKPPEKRRPKRQDGTPGVVSLPHGDFTANAVPDVFDERDLEYRARLQPLPSVLQCRPKDRYVMSQEGSSCTGHAVAAMINAVLAAQKDPTHVSPYMLYALARRYDEFPGDADEGSSLRGALKGWYYHGVLPDDRWPTLEAKDEPDLDHDDEVVALAARRPLGTFYRVNTTRLDDMQSAINELSAIAVTASIHDGWNEPKVLRRKDEELHVISRTSSSQPLGGHAFCLVGYNEVGFLVQNSWGSEWGAEGFATLPYDDWLETAYDAWVARPGVPSLVSARSRRKVISVAGNRLVDAPAPDIRMLANHVVNLGNDGRLSTTGRFASSTTQIDRLFAHLGETHDEWDDADAGRPRRIVLYAHGGLNSEKTGLTSAQRQVNWWLRNHVYPVCFAWQTGLTETLQDELTDLVRGRLPAGGGRFSLVEQVDRAVEKTVKTHLRWVWAEMKENAERASEKLPNLSRTPDDKIPGASLTVARLAKYLQGRPAEVHLVGHSAGSIFLLGVIEGLVKAGVTVSSLSYLAPALRTDEWMRRVLPHLETKKVKAFTSFAMDPVLELDDVVGAQGITAYHKSLLYLVSRGFEKPVVDRATEVPLVGMAHFADTRVEGASLADAVNRVGGELVWSTRESPARSRSQSTSHGGFDDDSSTMTSVLLRILGQDDVRPGNKYVPNLPPPESEPLLQSDPTALDDQPPDVVTAEVHGAGGQAPAAAQIPGRETTTRSSGRRGAVSEPSPVLVALERDGWT